jgi:uncharacterized YceG family protein
MLLHSRSALGLLAAAVLGAAALAGLWLEREHASAQTTPPPQTILRIIFPEGFTARQMVDRVAAVRRIAIAKRNVTPRLTARAYRRAVARASAPRPFGRYLRRKSIEGFLFPALYEFLPTTSADELVAKQLEAFEERWSQVDLRRARGRNPYEILSIASMIEGETVVPRERALVSAVIHNRLAREMPLGIDATIRYGLDIPGTESLTKKALRSDTPYNTRLRTGLPPTPIANPGLASIRAAANPARGVDYLYYVRKPNSKAHYFTANETDFLRKVCQYGYACD